jgi:GNAT superfamily N-acetyltransferase
VTLRRAIAGDQDALVRMGLLFHAQSSYARLIGVGNLAQLAEFLTINHDQRIDAIAMGAAFLLEVQGIPVGMIAGLVCTHHLSGEPALTEVAFYIEPGYRLGDAWSELVDTLEQWGAGLGATTSQLIAPVGARAVGRLYRRRGYVELETVFIRSL